MEAQKPCLINIAPLSEVAISSKSKWSTSDEEREILTAEHDRAFSFHTELEDSPWILVDLKKCYCISYIRILNRLDICQEKARTLRVEYSNDGKNYDILLDINEEWGDTISIPIKNIDIRLLRFSLKEKHHFHLKKIEIFTDLEYISRHIDDEKKEILNICNLIHHEFYERFFISYYDSNFSHIVLSERKNIKENIRYNIISCEKEVVFNIEIITKHYRDPDFYFFITTKAQKLNYKIKISKHKIYLVKETTECRIIEEIKYVEILLKYTPLLLFLKIISIRKLISIENKYDDNRSNIIIIDPDLMPRGGFADRLIGILSIIKICNEMNVKFFIKSNEPFELNKYYKFEDYNYIEHSRLKNVNHYSLAIGYQAIKDFDPNDFRNDMKEVILYSLKFYNIISLGINIVFSPGEYRDIFSKNFKRTDFFEEKLSHYRGTINGQYISISLRLLNRLGDFNESSVSLSNPLNENELVDLMNKCKQEIIKFKKKIDRKYSIVVLSDSSRFLNYISDIPSVYVFPENIMHIGKGPKNIRANEDGFIKTLIDFNIIMEASHIYRFETTHLYPTRFPWLASVCSGKPFSQHEF